MTDSSAPSQTASLQCAATTRKGTRCRNAALPDSPYCRLHAELATTPAPDVPPPPAAALSLSDSGRLAAAVTAAPVGLALPADTPDSAPLRAVLENQFPADEGWLDLVRALRDALHRLPPPRTPDQLSRLLPPRGGGVDPMQPELWGELANLLHYQLRALLGFAEDRLSGNYCTDAYGTDPAVIELLRPLLLFLYRRWWRVSVSGLEHVPAQGRAMLLANHSGVLPWDASMITTAVYEDHPTQRLVRSLYLDWFNNVPLIAPIFTALGQVSAHPDNARRLLDEEQLICIFPEGAKGIGKPFSQRYRLARFGRCGFVRTALQTGAPIIPVAVIGAEEIYPLIGNLKPVARMIGAPFFPVTPFFPWLGVLGAIPLPTRWHISILPPIPTAHYGAAAAEDPLLVFMLCEQVRQTIQQELHTRVAARSSVF